MGWEASLLDQKVLDLKYIRGDGLPSVWETELGTTSGVGKIRTIFTSLLSSEKIN